MVIFSLKEKFKNEQPIPDSSFFLEGDKNLCLLIHGLTGTPREMGSIAAGLNKKGYSVAAPLMEAHNKPLSALKRTSWQEFYASIKKEFLRLESHYDNVFVGGLSFGALLGILLTYEFPEKVKAINCFSPTLFFDGWNMPKVKLLLPLGYYTPIKYWFYFKEEYPYGIKNERLRARIAAYYTKSTLNDYSKVHLYGYPVIPISCMYQNHLLARRVISILDKVRTPIQILQAKEDDVTSTKNSYLIYDKVASEDKKVVLFEDSYHIITADQERDKVTDTAIAFFDKYRQRP